LVAAGVVAVQVVVVVASGTTIVSAATAAVIDVGGVASAVDANKITAVVMINLLAFAMRVPRRLCGPRV